VHKFTRELPAAYSICGFHGLFVTHETNSVRNTMFIVLLEVLLKINDTFEVQCMSSWMACSKEVIWAHDISD